MQEGSFEPEETGRIHPKKNKTQKKYEEFALPVAELRLCGHFSPADGLNEREGERADAEERKRAARRRRRSADVSQVCVPSSAVVKSRGSLTPRPSVTMEITSCQDGWRITGATEGRSLCGYTAGANHSGCGWEGEGGRARRRINQSDGVDGKQKGGEFDGMHGRGGPGVFWTKIEVWGQKVGGVWGTKIRDPENGCPTKMQDR